MKKSLDKKLGVIGILSVTTLVLVLLVANLQIQLINVNTQFGISFTTGSIHTTFKFYKNGVQVGYQYHAGSVTKLGLNMTMGKLTGNATNYNMTEYALNCTYISIGNAGTLNTDSITLPGEWNRTTGSMHDCTYNSFNLTAVFKPGTGPYTADCIGLNWYASNATSGTRGDLWGYDTFGEVTGIDSTFTITVEIKVSAS